MIIIDICILIGMAYIFKKLNTVRKTQRNLVISQNMIANYVIDLQKTNKTILEDMIIIKKDTIKILKESL